MLGDDEPFPGEQAALGQVTEGFIEERRPIGGIQKHQVELPPLLFEQMKGAFRVPEKESGSGLETELPEVLGEQRGRASVLLHKDRFVGAPTEGFDPQRPRAGEEIEHHRLSHPVADGGEQGLPDTVRGGPHLPSLGNVNSPTLYLSGDDAHAFSFIAFFMGCQVLAFVVR